MNTIAGRNYVMGRGLLDVAGRLRIVVIDISGNEIVSEHQKAEEATDAMIRYAKENNLETMAMAVASDFGPDEPLIVTETY